MRSGRWRCAARRRSASRRRTAWRSPPRAAPTSTTPTTCSPPRARRPSTCAGRSTRCAPIRHPSTPGGSTRRRSSVPLDGRSCGDSRPARGQGLDALQRRRARNRRLWIGRRCDSRGCGAGGVAHVWVDETRPLLQGARLTAFELEVLGIPHAVIVDGAAASLMAAGDIDIVITGAIASPRTGIRPTRSVRTGSPSSRAITGSRSSSWRRPRRSIRRHRTGGDPDRGARRGRGDVPLPGPQPRVRRHAGRLIAAIVTEEGVHRAPYAASLPAPASSR